MLFLYDNRKYQVRYEEKYKLFLGPIRRTSRALYGIIQLLYVST